MTALHTATGLCAFAGRRAGSDAERRAALWLAGELRARGRTAAIETFWCRPNWALAHAWHAALGLAASIVIVSHPRIGGALALVALGSIALDGAIGHSLGRRLTPERASQNVVAPGADDVENGATRLLVTANYDAGRSGRVYRPGPRSLSAALRRIAGAGRLALGWLGWIAIALLWLVVVAIDRNSGTSSAAIDVVQIVPSIALLCASVALLDLGLSPPSPAAGDNAAGVAVALATIDALAARGDGCGLALDLVLQGASDGDGTGLRHHLARRRTRPELVLGIAATGAGSPRWWHSDGPLWPLRYDRRLAALAAAACGGGTGHRGRGTTPALTARAAGLRAIAIGCLDHRGLVPRSHLAGDRPDALDIDALDAATDVALALVAAIERDVTSAQRA